MMRTCTKLYNQITVLHAGRPSRTLHYDTTRSGSITPTIKLHQLQKSSIAKNQRLSPIVGCESLEFFWFFYSYKVVLFDPFSSVLAPSFDSFQTLFGPPFFLTPWGRLVDYTFPSQEALPAPPRRDTCVKNGVGGGPGRVQLTVNMSINMQNPPNSF